MSINTIQNGWSDTRAKIKSKWNKFSESELDSFRDNLDKVPMQIQKTYGSSKEQSEKELSDFKISLHHASTSEKESAMAV